MAAAYFSSTFDGCLDLAERLPLQREFASMAQVNSVLRPAVDAARPRSPLRAPDEAVLKQAKSLMTCDGPAPGLNTVGMLLDRLTILAMKHWALIHRLDAPGRAAELVEGQVRELVDALAQARPGRSSLNNKLTTHSVDAAAPDFAGAIYGLFTTNLLLWEAQEVLYNRNMSDLPCDELRAYIAFFSEGNLQRNAFIEQVDRAWWLAAAA